MMLQLRARGGLFLFLFSLFWYPSSASAHGLAELHKLSAEVEKKILSLIRERKENQALIMRYEDASIVSADVLGACDCDVPCKDFLLTLGWSPADGTESCQIIYQKNPDYAQAVKAPCERAVSSCGLVKRQRRIAELKRRDKELEAEITTLEDEKKAKKGEIAHIYKVCPTCAMMEGYKPREPSGWDYALWGLQALTPTIMGGFNLGMGAIATNASLSAYQGQLQNCAKLGIPCNPPGGFGIGLGLAGMGGMGGMGGFGGGPFGGGMGGFGGGPFGGGMGGLYGAFGGSPFGDLGLYGSLGFGGNPFGGLGGGVYGGLGGLGGYGGFGNTGNPYFGGSLYGGNPYGAAYGGGGSPYLNFGMGSGGLSPLLQGGIGLGLGGGFNLGGGGLSSQLYTLGGMSGGAGLYGSAGLFGGAGVGSVGQAQDSQSLMMAAQQAWQAQERLRQLQGAPFTSGGGGYF